MLRYAVAMVLVARSALAHDVPQPHEHTPGPTTPAVTLGAVPGPAAVPTSVARPLRELAAEAAAVVLGRVTRSESFDADQLRVQYVQVERVLRGRLDVPEVGIVEMRGASRRPSLLADGETAVLLLTPAPSNSYLRRFLADGSWMVPAGGRDGIVPVGSDAELTAIEQVVAAPSDDANAHRRLAFAEIGGTNQRLADDGIVALRALPSLSPLADDELAIVARLLRDPATPPATRIALAGVLGDRGARDALPALLAADTTSPPALDAVLTARRRLGSPPTATELEPLLHADDPAVRAVAVRALPATSIDALAAAATADADASVRGAAVDALGATGRAEVLPVLSRTFASTERDLQQRSARAILAIGGPAADDALVALALHGDRADTRTYAVIVLLASGGAQSAAVRRLVASDPPAEVRHVIEHGLEIGHRHPTQ